MNRYNHMVVLAFAVISNDEQGNDITEDMLRAALLTRIGDLDREQTWIEAVGAPCDTFIYEDGKRPFGARPS